MRALLVASGVQADFVGRAVAWPQASIWYPTDTELAQANVVSAIVDPYRFAASGLGFNASFSDFQNALRRTPIFSALEAAAPAVFANSADLYQRHYFEGWSEGRITDELRSTKFAPLLRERLLTAPDDLQVDYARLLADQYEALGARDVQVCYEFATRGGDTRTVLMMPEALRQREIDLSIRVLRATDHRQPAPPALVTAASVALSQKLIDTFGVDKVRLLTVPMRIPSSQYGVFCQLSVAMFRTIADLPQDQAGAAMTNIFASMARAKAN
jgi:hypothetical protein